MQRYIGKVALISGTSGGIGAATARRLAAEGARVVLADINLAGAEKTAEGIRAAGGECFAHQFDLGDESSIKALIDATIDRYGRLDVQFNNAADLSPEATARDAALEFMDADFWDRTFRINTRGTMLMIKHALPHMVAQGGGAIINTSSGASLRADLFRAAYAASKAAINSLTEYVAAQYGKKGIRCNVVSPGLVITESVAGLQGHNFDLYLAHHLTPRMGVPDDIAAMVALLGSDDGRFINAQIIPIDGGTISHFPHVAETRGGVDAQKPVKA
jgi:NAD(P)-dependent dehydrogenase (short-subunit alcohol dehydrogenase family)